MQRLRQELRRLEVANDAQPHPQGAHQVHDLRSGTLTDGQPQAAHEAEARTGGGVVQDGRPERRHLPDGLRPAAARRTCSN